MSPGGQTEGNKPKVYPEAKCFAEPQKESGVSGQSSGQEQNGNCGTPPNWVLKAGRLEKEKRERKVFVQSRGKGKRLRVSLGTSQCPSPDFTHFFQDGIGLHKGLGQKEFQ